MVGPGLRIVAASERPTMAVRTCDSCVLWEGALTADSVDGGLPR